jgi:hypothetical protein
LTPSCSATMALTWLSTLLICVESSRLLIGSRRPVHRSAWGAYCRGSSGAALQKSRILSNRNLLFYLNICRPDVRAPPAHQGISMPPLTLKVWPVM